MCTAAPPGGLQESEDNNPDGAVVEKWNPPDVQSLGKIFSAAVINSFYTHRNPLAQMYS